jgi:hypothetical protein
MLATSGSMPIRAMPAGSIHLDHPCDSAAFTQLDLTAHLKLGKEIDYFRDLWWRTREQQLDLDFALGAIDREDDACHFLLC